MKINDRQKKLQQRYEKILIVSPAPVCDEWPKSGLGRSSFLIFCNGSKQLSRNSLNKLERFILIKERELGL